MVIVFRVDFAGLVFVVFRERVFAAKRPRKHASRVLFWVGVMGDTFYGHP